MSMPPRKPKTPSSELKNSLAGTKPGPGTGNASHYPIVLEARLLPAVAIVIVCLFTHDCVAKEPFLEFLRALQNRGYGEQALTYVDSIATRSDLPPEMKETLDLERSKSLRIAANETGDRQLSAARLNESKRFAEKFLKEHPSNPAGGSLLLSDADESLSKGEQWLNQAKGSQDKDVQARAFREARSAFTEAHERFDVAGKRLKERVDSLPKLPEGENPDEAATKQRTELTLPWVEARAKRALSDYLLSQTYDDKEAPERKKLLEQAGKEFDAIFNEYRRWQIGVLAHLWHGKTLDDLGDTLGAMEAYDEVLSVEPEDKADPAFAPLFGQAQLFRLQLRAKKGDLPSVIIKEGELWQTDHKKWLNTAAYQGIALEMVRARLRFAEGLKGAERTKNLRECIVALNTIAKVESDVRQQALLLRRDIVGKMGTSAALSQSEALALGDEAAADRNWTEASSFYKQSLEQAVKGNDAKSQDTIKSRLAQVLFRQAADQYGLHNLEKTLALCGELVRDYPDNPLAEDASALAISAALGEYSEATKDAKPAALARLEKVTSFALNRWPKNPVADDARMALAQVALQANDYPTAEKRLAEVNAQSSRYSTALHILGQVRWKQYLTAKKAPDAKDRTDEIQKLRDEAVSNLKTSLQRQQAAWQATSESMPSSLFETQLLMAEINLEAEQFSDAAALFAPLVQSLKSANSDSLDKSDQRALVGAIRAWLITGDIKSAADSADMLIKASPDEPQPNGILVELAKLVGQQVAQAAPSSEQTSQLTLAGPTDPLHALQLRLIDSLVTRKALTIPQLMYLGDACVQVGYSDKARVIYQQVLTSVDKDPSAKASAGAALTGIRARFARILRSEGKLEEAAAQIEALIKEHPSALEPLMERGYILQTLAERDPKNPKRYDDCVKHWTDIRVRLGRSPTRPPEYYDALYNTAFCLIRQSKATGDKKKAAQAEQLLKSQLTLTPNLNGPETVKKFQSLLEQAHSLREAS
jgi:tetratricopeptide (TPR) repeat protein